MATDTQAKLVLACPGCLTANRVPRARLGDDPKCGKCGARLLEGRPVALEAGTFDAFVERSELPVLVDFWAAWCGPCRLVAPIVEQLASDSAGKLQVGKLDVDANMQHATHFNIRSIPSILFFKDGKHVDTVVGAVPRAMLERKIQEHI